MRRAVVASALLLAAIGCASAPDATPAAAPQPASDPRIGEMQTSMTELLERIDVLNDRIARLEESRAEAAVQPAAAPRMAPASQPAQQAVTQQQTTPSAPRATSAGTAPAAQPELVGADIADAYRKAIVLYGKGNLADARRSFQGVYDSDKSGDLADNALFWIGETYYAGGDYVNAMRYYGRVVNEFADQNKAPDALFKIALAQERTGDLALARTTLRQVVEKYPYSSTASSAKQELQRIKF